MRSFIALLLASALVLPLVSCGGTTSFGFHSNFPAVSGTVSSAHLSFVFDGSTSIQVTVVTLLANGLPNQFIFCGDHSQQFPMDTSVKVTFDPGQNCNQIVAVVVG